MAEPDTDKHETAATPDSGGPGVKPYPAERADDGLERSFAPKAQDAGAPPASPNEGRLGPAADPAEGKPD